MPKTDINTILKNGVKAKLNFVDYNSPYQLEKLKELQKESERVLSNKKVNWDRLSRIYITI